MSNAATQTAGRDRHSATHEPTPGAGVIALYGYLSQGAAAGTRRLSEVPRGADYIEINARDIVDRFPANGDGHAAGRVAIWVRRDADVVSCHKVKASSFDGPTLAGRSWPRR